MVPGRRMKKRKSSILAISGGGDSRYLLDRMLQSGAEVILAHVHHGTRGKESDKDQEFVEKIAREKRIPLVTARMPDRAGSSSGFENRARRFRRRFLLDLKDRFRCGTILTGHTSDDQIETILMRMFEGAGIAGLKGIPRNTADGFYRPILHVWRDDITKYLKENRISRRTDRTNRDNRFERNWIRHVLIPLLVRRYGKAVKKRIFTLGERFQELNDYLEAEACKWIRRYVKSGQKAEGIQARKTGYPDWADSTLHFLRAGYTKLPTMLRVRIIQRVCIDLLGLAPNERLLRSVDRTVREGGPSARVKVGRGWELVNRYGQTAFVSAGDGGKAGKPPGGAAPGEPALKMEEKGKITPAQARRGAASGGKEYFDATGIRMPLCVRPLRAGDRIRPFGLKAEKKVKEIFIDRKVPRNERWGRPAVCDADGKILWIPGVIRSAHAPVTADTRGTIILSLRPAAGPGRRKIG